MRTLIVNPLGEVIRSRKNEPIGEVLLGSVNLVELGRRLGREPSNRDVNREFNRQLREVTTPEEYAVVQRIWRLQKKNDSRFRVYGGLKNGKPWAVLSTEFSFESDDKLRELKSIARKLGGKVTPMGELEPGESQFELTVPVEKRKALKAATQALWECCGVGVI